MRAKREAPGRFGERDQDTLVSGATTRSNWKCHVRGSRISRFGRFGRLVLKVQIDPDHGIFDGTCQIVGQSGNIRPLLWRRVDTLLIDTAPSFGE